MKKVNDCKVENCIPTPTSCAEWNGGPIDFLNICDGDSLNNVIWELEAKVKSFAAEDLSSFDIETLAKICGQSIPINISALSIFNLIKENEICLNDKIGILDDKINDLGGSSSLIVNLKCFAEFDNQGNALSIGRDEFDQLIIDNLCNQLGRIVTLEGKVIDLQTQINNIDISPTVDELSFATCINASVLPTSTQVINTSTALCDLIDSTGTTTDIATALALTPGDLNAEFGLIAGWDLTPENWAQNYGNLLLEVENLRQRIITIEENCCAITCEDVKLGFSVVYNEDNTGVILKFTAGAGTNIPSGFLDIGSTITVTDIDGNVETFTTSGVDLIANNAEIEVSIVGLNLNGDLIVDVDANISNGSLTCSKCLSKTVKKAACDFCEICATGTEGSTLVIVYETESSTSAALFETTTTTSTTTTTTIIT